MFDFQGKTILITGASGNLGWALVEEFAAAGATLLLPDRQKGRLLDKANQFDQNDIHIFENVDVTDKNSVVDLFSRIRKFFPTVDMLINTVGGYRGGNLPHEEESEVWLTMERINALSTLYMCQSIIPLMIEQGGGKIVNTASKSASEAKAKNLAYSASKAQVLRMTESMAKAYHADGISVNCVLPGTLDTPDNREMMPQADFSQWVDLKEIADLYLFLASDYSKVLNGALIPTYG